MLSNLSNLATYIFGSETQVTSEGEECRDITLKTMDADDDWVLVEKSESISQRQREADDMPARLPSLGLDTETRLANVQPSTVSTTCSSHSISSSPCVTPSSNSPQPFPLESSWFITPPPCFTSAGPIIMETSPMENLLIEHPSMSVYSQTQSFTQVQSRIESVEPIAQPLLNEERQAVDQVPEQMVQVPPGASTTTSASTTADSVQSLRHPSSLAIQEATERQMLKHLRSDQKVQQRRSQRLLKRNQLERGNKTRTFAATGKRHRRSDYMQNHSGANNNRKC